MLKEVKQDEGKTEKKELMNNWMRKGSGWKKEKGMKNRSSIKSIFPEGFFI